MGEHFALSVLPPLMRARIEENDVRELQEAAGEVARRAEEAESRAIMADHARKVTQASTGHSAEELLAARQAQLDYLASINFDPQAPVGSPQHPAILVGGEDLSARAAREQAAVSRYDATGIEAQLARHEAERAAWAGPTMRRVREAALEAEIRRGGASSPRAAAPVRREITRDGPPPGAYTNGLTFQRILSPDEVARLDAGDW
jgi:hypothetical protein